MYRGKRESVKVLAIDNQMYNKEVEPVESPTMDSINSKIHERESELAEWQAMEHKAYENDDESVRSEAMKHDMHGGDIGAVQAPVMNVQMYDRQKELTDALPRVIRYSGSAHPKDSEGPVEDIGQKASLFRRLVHGWTYQVYPVGLGTGAVYLLLYNLAYKSSAMTAIQVAFFLLSATVYIVTSLMLGLQAILYPSRATSLLFHPSTTIFVPFLALNTNSLIMGLINYAVPAGLISWQTVEVFFYLYIVLAIGICIPLLVNWYDKPHDIRTFTPAWAFLVFPLMLIGVLASRVLSVIPLEAPEAVTVFFLGYLFQGLGTCMTFFYLPIYLSRIMQTGFMEGHQANGAFVAAGPPGFTAVALVGLGRVARPIFAAHELHELLTEEVGVVFFGLGVFLSIFLLGLCLLFFLMALIPYHKKIHRRLEEVLGLWATTFPNVGMTITLRLLGDFFQSKAIHRVQYVMTAFVCSAYVMALSCTLVALFKGKIL